MNNSNEDYRFGLGEPLGIDNTILKVKYRETNEIEYFNIAASKVVLVRKNGAKIDIQQGTIAELMRNDIDTVFVYAPNNNPTIVYGYQH